MTVAEYLEGLPEPRRTQIRQLHELIRQEVPDLEPHVDRGMIGYGRYHYRYASGREGDSWQIGLSSRKQYISLYTCAANAQGYLAEQYAPRLGKADVGRSCIRFRKPEDLDLAVVRDLLRATAEHFRLSGGVQEPG